MIIWTIFGGQYYDSTTVFPVKESYCITVVFSKLVSLFVFARWVKVVIQLGIVSLNLPHIMSGITQIRLLPVPQMGRFISARGSYWPEVVLARIQNVHKLRTASGSYWPLVRYRIDEVVRKLPLV